MTRFRPFLSDGTLFVPAWVDLMVGQPVRFLLLLRDGLRVLEGVGEVSEVHPRATGLARRPGLLIRVHTLTEESRAVEKEILARRHQPPAHRARPAPPRRSAGRYRGTPFQLPTAAPPPEGQPPALDPAISWDGPTRPMTDIAVLVEASRRDSSAATADQKAVRRRSDAGALPINPLEDVTSATLAYYVDCHLDEVGDADLEAEPSSLLETENEVTVARPVPGGLSLGGNWRDRLPPGVRHALVLGSIGVVLAVCGWWVSGRNGAVPARPAEARPTEARPVLSASAVPASSPAGAICQARIFSRPLGALISVGGRPLGRTPLEGPVPCGESALELSHPRYNTLRQPLVAAPDIPAEVAVRMTRPPATLRVVSRPAGASVSVNGTAFGRAPLMVHVLRFERIHIEARLPGHRPWRQSRYLTDAETTVKAALGPRGAP